MQHVIQEPKVAEWDILKDFIKMSSDVWEGQPDKLRFP